MEKPRFRVIARENFKRTPWKNGLGWTDQIAIYPEGSELRRGDFDWRVSTARISQSADFSIFPNHDRVLVVLEGNGVRLAHQFEPGEAPEIVVLQKDGVYEFPGDIPTRCDLVSGEIQDLSVFIRQGVISANVGWLTVGSQEPIHWIPQGSICLIFVVEGLIEINDQQIPEGSAIHVEFTREFHQSAEIRSASVAKLLLIQMQRE